MIFIWMNMDDSNRDLSSEKRLSFYKGPFERISREHVRPQVPGVLAQRHRLPGSPDPDALRRPLGPSQSTPPILLFWGWLGWNPEH